MKKRIMALADKYKYVLVILLVGIVLMLLPTGKQEAAVKEPETAGYSLGAVEQEMEELLSRMDGVGRVRVMLTLKSGSALQLALDEDSHTRDSEVQQEKQVVKISRGSGQQEVVVTEEIYPTYLGAVVVCDGASSSAVQLRVTEAVSVLTALPSDKITVVKWEENA